LVKRGEVWWAGLAEAGRRPVLLLSRDVSYTARNLVTVAEITRTFRGLPVEIELDQSDGMPEHCCVNVDNIGTYQQERLESRITMLSPARMAEVSRKIIYALDLAPLTMLY
jgi:mRNA interferase MazF